MSRRTTRLRFFIATTAAGAAIAAGACSTFSTADAPSSTDASSDADPARDADTETSTVSDAGDANANDASLTTCSALPAVFEDNFAIGNVDNWQFGYSGCVDGGVAFEPHAPDLAAVLACTAPLPNAFSVLDKPNLDLWRTLEAAFSFRLVQHQHQLVFAQVTGAFGYGINLAFVYLSSPPRIALYQTGGSTPLATWTTTENAEWHDARIGLRREDAGVDLAVTATIDGQRRAFPITRAPDAGSMVSFQVGVFQPHIGTAGAAAYDDVKIWSCP